MTGPLLARSGPPPMPIKIFFLAVEDSGDQLGAALMRALRHRLGDGIRFMGVGGRKMREEGLASLHSTDDFSIVGVSAITARLPRLWRHYRTTMQAVRTERPDMLIVIDSPGYSLRVARAVRKQNPEIKIVDYVSPSVWAWAPSRARSMQRYIDRVLALLPFEPEVHKKLGGPPCSYVGHPIVEQAALLRPSAAEQQRRDATPPILLVLPGSRSGEIRRLAAIFGDTVSRTRDRIGDMEVVVPTAPHLVPVIAEAAASWPVRPRIVTEQADKQAAFRTARAALAKSGTVTLELAIAGVPMVAAYKVSGFDAWLGRRLVNVSSVILANLVIGENVIPEFLQADCTAERLAPALATIVADTPERRRQIEAFSKLDQIMQIGAVAPALKAADIVLEELKAR